MKKHIYIYSITILYTIIILSCNKAKNKDGRPIFKSTAYNTTDTSTVLTAKEDSTITLELAEFQEENILISDYVRSATYTLLETTDKSIIGEIDKIQVYNNCYYILDKYQTETLFVFNKDGSFKYSIEAEGRGPLEFTDPYDFTIDYDRNQLLIFDGRLSKIITYNLETGEVLQEKKLYYRISNLAYNGKGLFSMSRHVADNEHLPSINGYELYITDSLFNITNKFLERDLESKNDLFPRNDLFQGESINIYAPRFRNKIFEIKDTSINTKYNIYFDDIEVEKSAYSNYDIIEKCREENKYYFLSKYVCTENIDFICLSGKMRMFAFIDKQNNYNMIGGSFVGFDHSILPLFSYPVTADKDEFITYFNFPSIEVYKELNKEDFNTLPKEFTKVIDQMDSDSNPVILRYKITLNTTNQ